MAVSLMSSVSDLMSSRAVQASQRLSAKVQASSAKAPDAINARTNAPQNGQNQAYKVNISKTGMANFLSTQMARK